MNSRELLIIDDDEAIHEGLAAFCRERDITPYSAQNGDDGLRILSANPGIRTVLCDIRIPGKDGLDILREIKLKDPGIQVILMTAFGEKKLAIQALRFGADDFLEKPFRLPDLGQILDRSYSRISLQTFASRWQYLLENLPVGFIWCAENGKVYEMTPGAQKMLGKIGVSLIGRILWNVPEFAKTRSLLSTEHRTSVEIQIEDRWLVIQQVDIESKNDRGGRLLAISDVSEQKTLQSELKNLTTEFEKKVEERTKSLSEEIEFSQRLLDTADVLIAYFSSDGRLERFNKFAEDTMGMSQSEAEKVFLGFTKHKSSRLADVFDYKSREEVSGMVEELPTRDGTTRIFSWSARRLRESPGKAGRLIIGIEITEQKQLEATLQNYTSHLEEVVKTRSNELQQKDRQLFHSARLASLGEMAAGIAHEMKQPLNVISITADLIRLLQKNGTLTDELLHSNLGKIRGTVDRMATTINHLRGFTHIDSTNFEDLELSDAVRGAMSILGEQIRLENIDIEMLIPDSLPVIKASKNQIEQVLVNLLQNARDAIIDRQHAEANGIASDQNNMIKVRGGVSPDQQSVFVEIEDTGIGMTEEVEKRIFDPFYTTKDSARGTGLGLSISLEIVRSHGGEMQVESKEGRGSTFRLILPTKLSLEASEADDVKPADSNTRSN
ncbi:response regulator [bacterium]|nr:response regulator [bacterium]MBU1637105.1 response regulator [bacterium]MBU1919407.1 response regulator [bacterium]RQV99653.1 MAG: response regulator [bacterium]